MLILNLDELERLKAILQRENEPEILAKVQEALDLERWQENLREDSEEALNSLLAELKL